MKISWIQNVLVILIILITIALKGQSTNTDFERVVIKDDLYILSGIDLSNDQKTLAISSTQSNPFYLYDLETRQVKAEWDHANWFAGSEVQFSAKDNYVLLRQLFYLDFNLNKDREVEFEIIDAKTGRLIKRFVDYHQVIITEDEQYAVTITGDEIAFWTLPDAKPAKTFKVKDATNAIAVSPDGKWIAVSHKPDADKLKKDPRYKKNKKSLKIDSKFKERVSVFDTETFKLKYTVDDLYNIVYKLEFTFNGQLIFVQHIPHAKAKSATSFREAYVSIANASTGEALRKGFMSRTNAEPIYKLSRDGRYFGVVSFTNRFPEVQIYDFEQGKMLDRFELAYRLYEKNSGGSILPSDGRTAFDFLRDNETVVMINGNHLIYWKPQLNK
ncbi:MAG: hypothetical protein PHG67_12850 [Bacteroidales bacterium]|jgi:hypothetical protein|nr:hypothetical protein [Bacteroidales bacterium]HOI32440.1 hypothetical protein [Bacteroidales bacterium]